MKTNPIARKQSKNDVERFWSKVDRRAPDECWPWLAHTHVTEKYGMFRLNGAIIHASRFAYAISKGGVGAGLLVCHSCDNRPCCNPKHLWLGGHMDNTKDRDAKGRTAKGSRTGRHILKEAQVRSIKNDTRSTAEITSDYGVHFTTIYDIRKGRSWAWLSSH